MELRIFNIKSYVVEIRQNKINTKYYKTFTISTWNPLSIPFITLSNWLHTTLGKAMADF